MIHPKVSIVIINWNTWKYIQECLASLNELTYDNYEIIIVDNASSDDSLQKIRDHFPEVVLLENEKNMGSAGGNNTGMRYAMDHGSDYVWLLNNDALTEPDTLSILVDRAEEETEVGLISPVLYDEHDRTNVQYCGSCYDWKNFLVEHFVRLDDSKAVLSQDFWLWSTAVLIKRDVIESIGYQSQKYFVYCDDQEYCYKAIKAGFKCCIESKACVYHKSHYSGDVRKLPLHFYYYQTRNNYFFWGGFCPWYRKFRFARTYFLQICEQIKQHQLKAEDDIVDVYCDAWFSAVRNKGGLWDKSYKMPRRVKTFILKRLDFCIDLLGLHFINMFNGIRKNLGRKKDRKDLV